MYASENYVIENTSAAKLRVSNEGLERFQSSPLGLTAHWGLYALSHEGSEWIYYTHRIPEAEYRKRMKAFNPTRFCADEWADLMVEVGARYFMITSKHHDGFCLWDTALTDFKSTNTTFGRDILAELAEALHQRDLGLHFYYSLVDWTHPAYRNDWPAYVAYYQDQLRELLTNFGRIDGILFDGYWPRQGFEEGDEANYFQAGGEWDLAGTYDLIHELQPGAMVTNNAHVPLQPGEDYQVFELDLPGEDTAGFNTTEFGEWPMATWWNVNSGWSYQPWNHCVKTPDELLCRYQSARAMNASLFLNVGPRSFGDIHPEEQAVLRQFGQAIRASTL
jgi:alpha-L-fucosidase